MKKYLCLVALLCAPFLSMAALPPAYLSVPQFQQCLAQKQESTYTHWCLPATKPDGCPDGSWSALQVDDIPAC